MGKKGKKTRWRRLPIGGTDEESGLSLEPAPPSTDSSRITFNEDEYTKITTPRQDVLFKKGYFGRKRTPNPSPSDTQEAHSGDSVESESYVSEDTQYVYPTGYMDPTGVYFVNGNTFETFDPYTGMVTVVVGPPPQYPGGAPVLAALPCQPVPLQPVEWFNPPAPWCYSYNRRKRYSTDSQNCSAQSSESTGPPGSPQEPVEEGACAPPLYPPQYVYPGYMFGPPVYNMNGVTMQGMVPQPVPLTQDLSASKRRKKRRRRRRGGVTEDGSESSCCEEPLTCDVTGSQSETGSDAVCQSGASSDGGVSSKANSDSGINTDPTPNSGSNSPPLLAQVPYHPPEEQLSADCVSYQNQGLPMSISGENVQEDSSLTEVTTPEEVTEELSTAEDDVTPNLCAAAPEFSSQESTLSCLSTPSASKEFVVNESEVSNAEISHEVFESCQSVTEPVPDEDISQPEDIFCNDLEKQSLTTLVSNSDTTDDDLKTTLEKKTEDDENKVINPESNGINVEDEIKEICYEEVKISEVSELQTNISLESIQPIEIIETFVSTEEEKETELLNICEREVRNEAMEPQCTSSTSTNADTAIISECEQSFSRFSSCRESIAPVPPPRRKRSMSRAADKLASRIVEEAINEGIEEACERLRSPMSITEAVTRWLNSQGSSPLTCPISDSESGSDDEGIEVEDGLTDQKNVRGNPFLVSSHSGTGQRVAKDCESLESSAGEWDMWDHSHTRDMCDPTRSVDRYYRLGADDSPSGGDRDKVPPSVYKTAMHIRHTGPFPCGVCCIIQ